MSGSTNSPEDDTKVGAWSSSSTTTTTTTASSRSSGRERKPNSKYQPAKNEEGIGEGQYRKRPGNNQVGVNGYNASDTNPYNSSNKRSKNNVSIKAVMYSTNCPALHSSVLSLYLIEYKARFGSS